MNTARTALCNAAGRQPEELSSVEQCNRQLLGEARLVLIGVAMLVDIVQFAGAERVALLVLLGVYAAVSYRDWQRVRRRGAPTALPVNHWVDLACYLPAAAMTGGFSSPYSVFLLFPVFTACLRTGMHVGLAVAAVCGATLATASLSGQLAAQDLFDNPPVAPVLLGLVVAVVIARWAHSEITIVRRLALCNDVSRMFTPQHDLRRAVSEFAQMLCAYQHADSCVVLLKDTRTAGWLLFELGGGSKPVRGDVMSEDLVQPLLVVPPDRSVLYRQRSWFSSQPVCEAYDSATLEPDTAYSSGAAAELAELLEAGSLVSLPLRSSNRTIGRLHLTSRGLAYGRNDVEFLSHVIAQVGVMIENMQLVERLTLEVANEERKRISRDLHDGTIQPYIGLKLALEALHRRVAPDAVLTREVDDLIKMATDGISQLRHYVGHLKSAAQRGRLDSLVPAIRRQAEKFSEYYGITTEVVASAEITLRGDLFDEVLYLVREGLSNIRRHTRARSAQIFVDAADGRLALKFSNETGADAVPDGGVFYPRSLSERARELGGAVTVHRTPAGMTIVSIEIPV